MNKKTQKGFAHLETFLLLIIVAVIAFTGYYVWHSRSQANKTLNDAASINQAALASSKKTNQTPQAAKSSPVSKPITPVASTDNAVQVDLPQDLTVQSKTEGGQFCGFAPTVPAPGTCILDIAIKGKLNSYYAKFFKTNETAESWYSKSFGQCVSAQAKTLNKYAELICKSNGQFEYVLSNGKYVADFVGDDSSDFLSVIQSTKLADQ